MARRIKNVKLDTRTARQSLEQNKNPYWVRMDKNAHMGYRKGAKGGYWVARVRMGNSFKMSSIATADDTLDADGIEILDYFQAQTKAREWFEYIHRLDKGIGIAKYTVNNVLDDYIEYLENHGKSAQRAQYSIDAYIRPEFGTVIVSELTSRKITDWHKKLAEDKPRQRAKKGRITFKQNGENGDDYKRKRKSSANRILTIFKAALNRAYNDSKVANDDAWRRVKPYRNVDNPRIRFLALGECGRLVNACEPDFRKLVQAGLLSGCRYGELINMRIDDYNSDSGTLFVSDSKSGKPRHVTLEDQGYRFFDRHVIGKKGNEYMFVREDGQKWGRSHQTRRLKNACRKAQIFPAISFHILRHTHASTLVQRGVPLPVIAAQLGHADTRVCEKHYAHLTNNYISDTIRAHFPDMQIIEEDNEVISIESKRKK